MHLDDKDLEKIQQIIISIKIANLAKHITDQIADLAMMTKKNQSNKLPFAKSNEKYFHYGKKIYYTNNYHSGPKKKLLEEEKIEMKAKQG